VKPNYKKVFSFRARHEGDFYYDFIGKYHRPVRTFPELRENYGHRVDLRGMPRSCQPRFCRGNSELDAWNDFKRSRDYGKSWKHYTRHRKQWMVGNDPRPVRDHPTGLAASLQHWWYDEGR
jgi:hypothetical protein